MALTSQQRQRIETLFDDLFQAGQIPGLALIVLADHQLAFIRTHGLADRAQRRPVTPQTVFRIGSISKTMTAIGIMQLYEQGRVDLDAPVQSYLQSLRVSTFRPTQPAITLRQLLTHTAGLSIIRNWPDLLALTGRLALPAGRPIPTLADYYHGQLRASAPAGQHWLYANDGYAVLGQVLAEQYGCSLAAALQQQLFAPLGMAHSDYQRSERVRDMLALGYDRQGRPVRDLEIILQGAGSVYASVEDMARYALALLNGAANEYGRVLQPATLELMLQPHVQLHPRLQAMGLGFLLYPYGEARVIGHTGGWPGFASLMLLAPQTGVGVLLFANHRLADGSLEVCIDRIMRILLKMPEVEPLAAASSSEVHSDWHLLQGYYLPDGDLASRLVFSIEHDGGYRVTQRGEQLWLSTPIGELQRGVALHPLPDEALAFQYQQNGLTQTIAFEQQGRQAATALLSGLQRFSRLHAPPGHIWLLGAGVALGLSGLLARLRRIRRNSPPVAGKELREHTDRLP